MDWIPVAVESTLTVFAIGFFWNSPRKNPPRGLNTTSRVDSSFAQIFFFPLFIFNLIDLILGGVGLIRSILTQETYWLFFPILLSFSLYNALIYYPIHMAFGNQTNPYYRIIGIVLISVQIVGSVLSFTIDPIKITTFYAPFYFYSLSSICWLMYPPIWDRFFAIFYRKNWKLFLAYHLSAVALLIATGFYIQIMINLNITLEKIEQWFGIDLGNSITANFYIGIFSPIVAYLSFLILNYLSFGRFVIDHTTISSKDILSFETSRFLFTGMFVGYQIVAFSFLSWILWTISFVIYILAVADLFGTMVKWITLTVLIPIIILLFIFEIFRTFVGIWVYGRSYRPFPRKLDNEPIHTEFNVYWEHFEYFTFFYSILLGGLNFIGNLTQQIIEDILWSTFPKHDGSRIIDIGFKTTDECLLA